MEIGDHGGRRYSESRLVDQHLAAQTEGGDTLIAEQRSATHRDQWILLGDVVRGERTGHRTVSVEVGAGAGAFDREFLQV